MPLDAKKYGKFVKDYRKNKGVTASMSTKYGDSFCTEAAAQVCANSQATTSKHHTKVHDSLKLRTDVTTGLTGQYLGATASRIKETGQKVEANREERGVALKF